MSITSILIFIASLTACGGGSSSTNVPTTPPPPPVQTVLTGKFIDAAVQGLSYQTATQSGTTDETGQFSYIAGETITFSIGDIEFPTINAASILTPLSIFTTTDINDNRVVNLARFLQTLDEDGNTSNGITISTIAHTQSMGAVVDFASANFEQQVETIVANSGSSNVILISAADAINHLQASIDVLNSSNCTSDHPKVGYTGEFSTLAHDVSGKATILNDCSILIEMFNYDGSAPLVYFYAALNKDFAGSNAFSIGPELSTTQYNNATFTIALPSNKSLDDFDSLSVWCVEFSANFGDLVFSPTQ